jgi:hypothetical protein
VKTALYVILGTIGVAVVVGLLWCWIKANGPDAVP